MRTGAALVALGSSPCSVGDGAPASRMIAVADGTAGATLTANTVLLAGAPRPSLGATVRVGGGALLLEDGVHRIARYWRSGVSALPIDPAALHELTIPCAEATGLAAATIQPLLTALITGADLAAAARSLVGRGPGSTPAGDDVLAGVAFGLRLTDDHARLADLQDAISPDLGDRTSALSADLLRAALAGHASPEVLSLARTLRPGVDPAARRQAVDAVLRLGSTSGADLLTGLTGALRVASFSSDPGPHPRLPAHSRRMATR